MVSWLNHGLCIGTLRGFLKAVSVRFRKCVLSGRVSVEP